VNKFLTILAIRHWITLGLSLSLAGLIGGCTSSNVPIGPTSLNSRTTEQQPTLSADGRFLAFISNRTGSHNVWLYDLQQRQFVQLPGLNRVEAIASSPSLSNTARYITYLISDQGRPAIVVYDRLVRKSRIIYEAYQGTIRNPRISPDGRYIVFENGLRGQWDIGVIDRGPNIELDLLDGVPLGPSLTQ
jgi:Tol biopolymer transport system component